MPKYFFKKNTSDTLIIFLVTFVPRVICNLSMSPVMVIMDEVCSINSAAYFAGLDWSNVVSIGGYYGIGYFGLFAPLFALTDNSYIIYYTVLISLSLLQSLAGVICYKIVRNIFKVTDNGLAVLIAVCCSYMVVFRSNNIVNEAPLNLLTWIIIWLLLCLVKGDITKNRKNFLTIALIALLCYSLLLHTRALTYWIGLVVLVIGYFLCYKRCIISLPATGICAILLVPLSQMLIKHYQANMWKGSNNVLNTSISIVVSEKYSFVENFKGAVAIILGEINAASVLTGGILYIAFVCCIILLVKCIIERKKYNLFDANLFVIVVFCGCGVGATIMGMIFSGWHSGVVEGMINDITKDYYSYKAITYLRYFGPYISPLLMVFFLYMYKYKESIRKIIYVTLFFIIIPIQLYWIDNIIGLIGKNSTTHGAFILFSMWNESKELGEYIYYYGIQGMIFFLFLFLGVYRWKKQKGAILLLTFLLVAQYFYGTYVWDVPWANESNEKVNDTYGWVKELEAKTVLPTTIYVQDNLETSHHKTALLYQFLLSRYEIRMGEPDTHDEEAILFINSGDKLATYGEQGYKILQLDEEEYVCIKGERLINEVK